MREFDCDCGCGCGEPSPEEMDELTKISELAKLINEIVIETPITDIHTHTYPPGFGNLMLWGIDELLTYHYLIAETMRYIDMPYEKFWALSKKEQADIAWKTLFLDRSPISEACRGVLTTLQELGLDTESRNLDGYREYFKSLDPESYVDEVFEIAGLESLVMTNDPFDDLERPLWLSGVKKDSRFHAALRIDGLLNMWDSALPRLKEWGYEVQKRYGRPDFCRRCADF